MGDWSLEGGDERNPFGLAFTGNNSGKPIFILLWGSPVKFSRILDLFGANIQPNVFLVKITVPKYNLTLVRPLACLPAKNGIPERSNH